MSIVGLRATICAMNRPEPSAALQAARALLEEVTPLHRNCGALCAAACCAPDDSGRGGMLLFPGEVACYTNLPPGFAISKDHRLVPDASLLTCEGSCERSTRPLACRVFPLMFTPEGVALDPRAWPICPLMDSGIEGLRADFVQAAKEAASRLFEDPAQQAFITAQHHAVAALTAPLWQEGRS